MAFQYSPFCNSSTKQKNCHNCLQNNYAAENQACIKNELNQPSDDEKYPFPPSFRRLESQGVYFTNKMHDLAKEYYPNTSCNSKYSFCLRFGNCKFHNQHRKGTISDHTQKCRCYICSSRYSHCMESCCNSLESSKVSLFDSMDSWNSSNIVNYPSRLNAMVNENFHENCTSRDKCVRHVQNTKNISCEYCIRSGQPPVIYNSHRLRNSFRTITCPILKSMEEYPCCKNYSQNMCFTSNQDTEHENVRSQAIDHCDRSISDCHCSQNRLANYKFVSEENNSLKDYNYHLDHHCPYCEQLLI